MAHYFDKNPTAQSRPHDIPCKFSDISFSFASDSNVFSKNNIDFGSRFLIDTVIADIQKNALAGSLLDLGCGYGVVGIVLKRLFPHLKVTMTDINERALELAKENMRRNQVSDINIIHSDGWTELIDLYDMILTNPPVRAGKKTVFSFYNGAFEHLKKNGRLYVVLQKKQGADSSIAYLENLFGNCCILEKDSGYRVFMAEKEV